MEIDAEQFVAVKGFKAKGKRISTFNVEKVDELEPLRFPDPLSEDDETEDIEEPEPENLDEDAGKSEQQVRDELTGQLNLFDGHDI